MSLIQRVPFEYCLTLENYVMGANAPSFEYYPLLLYTYTTRLLQCKLLAQRYVLAQMLETHWQQLIQLVVV